MHPVSRGAGVGADQAGRKREPLTFSATPLALPHRVVPHVLYAARDSDVGGAERDAARRGGRSGERSRAHPVDRVAGNRTGQPGQYRGGPADGQPLVADLGGGRDGDVADAFRRQARVPAQQLADHPDDQVVGAGLRVQAVGTGLAERGTDAVQEDRVASGTGTSASLA